MHLYEVDELANSLLYLSEQKSGSLALLKSAEIAIKRALKQLKESEE